MEEENKRILKENNLLDTERREESAGKIRGKAEQNMLIIRYL